MTPITIAQTREDIRLAFEVQQNSAITFVRLARAKLVSQALDDAAKGPVAINFRIKSRSVQAPKGTLRIEVDFRMTGDLEDQAGVRGKAAAEAIRLVSVACTYAVDYQLREDFEPSTRQVNAFKDGNVIFNCWPYFREYLQDTVQRMGFPPLTAPFLRVQPKPPRSDKKPRQTPTGR